MYALYSSIFSLRASIDELDARRTFDTGLILHRGLHLQSQNVYLAHDILVRYDGLVIICQYPLHISQLQKVFWFFFEPRFISVSV